MGTKIIKCKPFKGALIEALKPQMLTIVEEQVATQLENMIKELYELTFAFWQGGAGFGNSRSGARTNYSRPVVKFEKPFKITVTGTTKIVVRIRIHSIAADGGGKPHELWYWLDFGTKTIQWDFPYPSAEFRPRGINRTTPGKLEVKPAAGYGEPRRIYPGGTRKGIKERMWSRQIGIEVERRMTGTPLGKQGWQVVHSTVIRPK